MNESPFRLRVPGWLADGFMESGEATRDDIHLALHNALSSPLRTWAVRMSVMVATDCPVASVEALRRFCEQRALVAVNAPRRERDAAAKWGRWATRLDTELNHLSRHPAYTGLAVKGTQTVVLPAYRATPCSASARWWPLPRMALDADRAGESAVIDRGLLVPVEVWLRGTAFTRWEVRPV